MKASRFTVFAAAALACSCSGNIDSDNGPDGGSNVYPPDGGGAVAADCGPTGLGRTLYVDPNGSNTTGDGSAAAPWQTIQFAVDQAQPGDTVLANPGTYRERVVLNTSGTSELPITIAGTMDAQGEHLSIIDGSDPFVATWVQATDVDASGRTWKATAPYRVCSLNAEEGYIFDILPQCMDSGASCGNGPTASNIFSLPPTDPYWDGWEAQWGQKSDMTLYLRFRDGESPSTHTLAIAPDAACNAGSFRVVEQGTVTFRDTSHVRVCGFQMKNGANQVVVSGESSYNVVDQNDLRNGYHQVVFSGPASYNRILHNEMHVQFYGGTRPGAHCFTYSQECDTREENLKAQQYINQRYGVTPEWIESVSIDGDNGTGGSTNNEIGWNEIHDTMWAFFTHMYSNVPGSGANHSLHHNQIYATGSEAIIIGMQVHPNLQVHDNFVSDTFDPIRFQGLNFDGGEVYVYNNTFVGGTYLHSGAENVPTPGTIWAYHNTWVRDPVTLSGWLDATPNVHFINNIISPDRWAYGATVLYGGGGQCEAATTDELLGTFAHNWLYLQYSNCGTEVPTWNSGGNVVSPTPMWPTGTSIEALVVPPGTGAEGAGIDISQPFTLEDVEYPALPGFSPGYFEGSRPNIGVVAR